MRAGVPTTRKSFTLVWPQEKKEEGGKESCELVSRSSPVCGFRSQRMQTQVGSAVVFNECWDEHTYVYLFLKA